VAAVFPASTAKAAGMADGDVLVAVAGSPVRAPLDVVQAMAHRKAGETVTLEFRHDGRPVRRTLELAPYPAETGEGWDVEYGSVRSSGGRLRTIWTRPRTPGRHPALFLIQGIGTFSTETPLMGVDAYREILRDFAKRGFVTLRVDKPGCGDSEGGPLRDVDFDTQLDGFRQALAALRADPAVDPNRILIFGHSMGGVWGPLLAAETPVRGIAVYGTLCTTWMEYLLDNTRRQSALEGRSPAAVDSLLQVEAQVTHYLYAEDLTPQRMAELHPELRSWVDSSMTQATYYSGCHYTFFQQLAKKNLAAAWQAYPGSVLSLYGRSDFLSNEADHARIARIVNQAHPGHAVFEPLDGIDHAFRAEPSQAESYSTWAQTGGAFDPAVLNALRTWSEQIAGKSTP